VTIVCVSVLNECDWNCTLTTRTNVKIHGLFWYHKRGNITNKGNIILVFYNACAESFQELGQGLIDMLTET
jgi:hypothetical protein